MRFKLGELITNIDKEGTWDGFDFEFSKLHFRDYDNADYS